MYLCVMTRGPKKIISAGVYMATSPEAASDMMWSRHGASVTDSTQIWVHSVAVSQVLDVLQTDAFDTQITPWSPEPQ